MASFVCCTGFGFGAGGGGFATAVAAVVVAVVPGGFADGAAGALAAVEPGLGADTPPAGQRLDRVMDLAIAAGLIVLILVGFAASYGTLRDLAATAGGYPAWLAPAIPLSFDLGIVVLSLKVARAAREGRTAPVLRLLIVALSAATVAANISAATTIAARLLHAVPPAMFVICFESVVITARRAALDRQGLLPHPLPRLSLARWILAPRASWSTWRQLVLAEGLGQPNPPAPALGTLVVDGLPPIERPAASSQGVTIAGSDDYSREGWGDRTSAVRALVREDPAVTAPQIRARLHDLGHVVSTRTAQRLRAGALRELHSR
jgi:Protein of unknown function (DUF2637)